MPRLLSSAPQTHGLWHTAGLFHVAASLGIAEMRLDPLRSRARSSEHRGRPSA